MRSLSCSNTGDVIHHPSPVNIILWRKQHQGQVIIHMQPLSHCFVSWPFDWRDLTCINRHSPTSAKFIDSLFKSSLFFSIAVDSIESINRNTLPKAVWVFHDNCRREKWNSHHNRLTVQCRFNSACFLEEENIVSGAQMVYHPPSCCLFCMLPETLLQPH